MRLTVLTLGLLLPTVLAREPPQPGFLNSVLASGPVTSLCAKLGINITKTLELPKYWDERIQLITDDNYQDIIVNEQLTEEEQRARTWAIIITATAGDSLRDGLSKLMDEMFDAAYNETVIAGDIPNVRWGRIDYLNVTYLTTKWSIWSTPYLLILRNQGQDLRFYKGQHLRLRESELRTFLKAEDWKHTPTWASAYAPGGSREFILHYFAICMAKIYNLIIGIPRWLFILLSGAVGSVLLRMMHTPSASGSTQRPSTVPSVETDAVTVVPSSEAPITPNNGSTKKRKRGMYQSYY